MSTDERFERELDRRLAALTRRADPDPALWEAIEPRLRLPGGAQSPGRSDTDRAHRRMMWPGLAIAASMAGVLGLSLILLNPRHAPDTRTIVLQTERLAMQEAAPEPLPTTLPDAPAALMSAWAENQSAIDELERALQREPENRLLLDFLAQARLRQARLLQQAMTHTQTRSIQL